MAAAVVAGGGFGLSGSYHSCYLFVYVGLNKFVGWSRWNVNRLEVEGAHSPIL